MEDYSNMTGLVLDGGGGKGAYQIGVLKALMEENLLADVGAVSGVSIGAVNGILYAMGNVDTMYRVWDDIDMGTIFDLDLELMMQQGYFSREEMNRLMDKYMDFEAISQSPLTIFCGVCRMENDQYYPEYMQLNGKNPEEIKQILMASTAMPIVYEPVLIDGKPYRDGGIKDNEPIQPLYDLGIRKFIVIGLNSKKVFDSSRFPDAEFIVIYPSHDLGDLISGTLNFEDSAKEFRTALGYKDGKRAIKTKFEKNETYIHVEAELARNDYQEIVNQMHVAATMQRLNASVSANLDKFDEIAKKYDI